MAATPRSHARPARQQRSRKTRDGLLDAAESLLEEKGLEAATVPAIAARCGMSVGVVYRRFPDKDALLRAVTERFFARSRESNRSALEPSRWSSFETGRLARLLVAGMVAGYRQRRGLLRALYLYAETHPDRRFRRRADALTEAAFQGITELLLSRKSDLAHPDPAAAVRLGLLAVGSTLRTLVLSPTRTNPFGDEARLETELARLFLSYLGIP